VNMVGKKRHRCGISSSGNHINTVTLRILLRLTVATGCGGTSSGYQITVNIQQFLCQSLEGAERPATDKGAVDYGPDDIYIIRSCGLRLVSHQLRDRFEAAKIVS
jgi:hypothetical protein